LRIDVETDRFHTSIHLVGPVGSLVVVAKGNEFTAVLTDAERNAIIEYLKTL
jgi:hypothetical protein